MRERHPAERAAGHERPQTLMPLVRAQVETDAEPHACGLERVDHPLRVVD
ncbi:MAG: hypothetical protein OXE50_13925 [Chloroflexi bacterium]|nr:hypothetical protein [Chloroflexota bacterium]